MSDASRARAPSPRHDLLELTKALRYDLTAAQAKLTELMALVARLPDGGKGRARCEECGLTFKGPLSLAEHRYHAHGGEEPAHWLAAEARAEEATS